MPPRKRTKRENRTLPPRWEWHGGKIYYQIPPSMAGHHAFDGRKRRLPLGATLTEAHRKWADIQRHFDSDTGSDRVPDVIQQYIKLELPYKAAKTRRDYAVCLARISGAFQEFTIHDIKVAHCIAYVDANMDSLWHARYDMRVLSSVLSWCVSRGKMDANPLLGQLKFKGRHNPKRKRHYTPDEDIAVFLSVLPPMWQLYVRLKLKTGQSQQTLLTTTRKHLTSEGIDFERSKTGASIPMEWDDELRAIVDELLALPRRVGSVYLFSKRDGGCYYDAEKGTASGFQSMWQRWQKKAMERGMSSRFSEHQLRHKAASDNPLGDASKAMGHADERITRDVYQVKKQRIKPLKGYKKGD